MVPEELNDDLGFRAAAREPFGRRWNRSLSACINMLILPLFIVPGEAASRIWDQHPIAFLGFCALIVGATQWSRSECWSLGWFFPPNKDEGLFHRQRIAQMHLVGFAEPRNIWWNLCRETKRAECKISLWNCIFSTLHDSHFVLNYRVH